MPRRGFLRAALIGGTLAAGLAAGCAAACVERATRAGRGDGEGDPGAPAPEPLARLTVFAEKAFYLERGEPEETLHGVLRRAEVRVGPNTREMPFRLVVEEGELLSVYVSGFDLAALRPFVDRRVKVVGKRVDLRPEGYAVEIWIASIALDRR